MAARTARLSHFDAIVPVLANISSNSLDFLVRSGFAGISRGRELTRKSRRLAAGLPLVDGLIGGGIARGRISELTGGAGKTSLAAAFAANALRDGEVAAWLDLEGCCDPVSMAAAGIDLERMLWTAPALSKTFSVAATEIREQSLTAKHAAPREAAWIANSRAIENRIRKARPEQAMLKAAEWLMAAGGFGLIVIDFGRLPWPLRASVAMRLARGAEQSGTALIILSARRLCGTFAALSLVFDHSRPSFSRMSPDAPLVFDGFVTDLRVMRNKLGGSHGAIVWKLTTDPYALNDDADNADLADFAPPAAIAANDCGFS